jgi:Mrp family chromosome partitioning ATPase
VRVDTVNRLAVLSATEGAPWEERLLRELTESEHGARIVRRCVDIVDLLAVAAIGQGQAALVSSGLHRLDADAVERLGAAGVAVVAVLDVGQDASEVAHALRAVGIHHVVGADAPAAVVAAVLDTAVGQARSLGDAAPERSFAWPTAAVELSGQPAPIHLSSAHSQRRGAVVAVWGPTGGPGRSTVAVALADELGRLGADSLLVDCDVYGGSIAAMLGLLDESPGIAAAARNAGTGHLDVDVLAGLCWQLEPRLRVLTGLPRADRWPELRPSAIAQVIGVARELADFTVIDVGFCLESDEELSYDTLAPRRNGATLAVLDEADVVLAVGSADPLGIHRLARGLEDMRAAEIAAPIWIVLNRVRPSATHSAPEAELSEAVTRFTGQPPAAYLPLDLSSCDASMLAATTLGHAAGSSALRLGIVELAAALSGRSAASGPGRRHRKTRTRLAVGDPGIAEPAGR